MKIGRVRGRGCTGTQSGDGNSIKKIKKIIDGYRVVVPTQETIQRPVYKKDYLRYWCKKKYISVLTLSIIRGRMDLKTI